MPTVNELKVLLNSFDRDVLAEVPPGSFVYNDEQRRLITELGDMYGIDDSLQIHAAIHQLLCGVVGSFEEEFGGFDDDGR